MTGKHYSNEAMPLCILHTPPVMRVNSISYNVVGQV